MFNWTFQYPAPVDIDKSLNETDSDKIRDYRTDYNNRPSHSISFMTDVVRTSVHLHCERGNRFLHLQE